MTKSELDLCKRALYDVKMAEIARYEKLAENLPEHSSEFNEKMAELIEQTRKKEASFVAIYARKLILVAIISILILSAAVSVLAFNPKIKQFLIELFESHVAFEISGDNSHLTEMYHLSFIPEGFEKIDQIQSNYNVMQVWERDNENIILEQEAIVLHKSSIDMDDNQYQEQYWGDLKIYFTISTNQYAILWIEDNYSFSLTCSTSIPWDEIEKMILGIEPVE